MKRYHRLALAAATLLVATAAMQEEAGAHPAATYYTAVWRYPNQVAHIHFMNTFPTGNKRARMLDGVAQWNAVGQPMQFQLGAEIVSGNPTGCPAAFYTLNGLFYRNITENPNALGVTYSCSTADTNTMVGFNLSMDNDRNWYDGTGNAADPVAGLCLFGCEWDFWSVATHEFGHATGFVGGYDGGHFAASDPVCADNSSQATMCPSVSIGTERLRDLSDHDRHTFDAAY